jgi:hypothetical protein
MLTKHDALRYTALAGGSFVLFGIVAGGMTSAWMDGTDGIITPTPTATRTPTASATARPSPTLTATPVNSVAYPPALQAVVDEAKEHLAKDPLAEWWYLYPTADTPRDLPETFDVIYVPQYRDTVDSPAYEAFVVNIYIKITEFEDEAKKASGRQVAAEWFRNLGVLDLSTLEIVWNYKPASYLLGEPTATPGCERWEVSVAEGSVVNVRESPGLQSPVVGTVTNGFVGCVVEGPVEADGHQWRRIQDMGWLAGEYLRPAGASPMPTTRGVPTLPPRLEGSCVAETTGRSSRPARMECTTFSIGRTTTAAMASRCALPPSELSSRKTLGGFSKNTEPTSTLWT